MFHKNLCWTKLKMQNHHVHPPFLRHSSRNLLSETWILPTMGLTCVSRIYDHKLWNCRHGFDLLLIETMWPRTFKNRPIWLHSACNDLCYKLIPVQIVFITFCSVSGNRKSGRSRCRPRCTSSCRRSTRQSSGSNRSKNFTKYLKKLERKCTNIFLSHGLVVKVGD